MARLSLISGISLALCVAAVGCSEDDIIYENAVSANIRVVVTDSDGVPVSGAPVVIEVFEPDVAGDPQPWAVTGTRTTDAAGAVNFELSVFLAPPCDCPSEARVGAPPGSGLADRLIMTTLRLDDPAPPVQVIEVTLTTDPR